ncbi:hypothetical protein LG3211_1142 [Lysobacter gummosus]|nr:hypothetical protein LG3211_1142 [Lysobacter gummosus]
MGDFGHGNGAPGARRQVTGRRGLYLRQGMGPGSLCGAAKSC